LGEDEEKEAAFERWGEVNREWLTSSMYILAKEREKAKGGG
jgi:hypothetical protein